MIIRPSPLANSSIAAEIEGRIRFIRGHKVLLDEDLAPLYGVETKSLNLAVKRHVERFPADFMFQLTHDEHLALRFQIETSKGRGGRRFCPYAFTQEGVAMLSSVLNSPRAIAVNIEIMRAFVRLRQLVKEHAGLSKRLDELESKYDRQFRVVFEAIRSLMAEGPASSAEPIGFRTS
jgi:hypothetical protein